MELATNSTPATSKSPKQTSTAERLRRLLHQMREEEQSEATFLQEALGHCAHLKEQMEALDWMNRVSKEAQKTKRIQRELAKPTGSWGVWQSKSAKRDPEEASPASDESDESDFLATPAASLSLHPKLAPTVELPAFQLSRQKAPTKTLSPTVPLPAYQPQGEPSKKRASFREEVEKQYRRVARAVSRASTQTKTPKTPKKPSPVVALGRSLWETLRQSRLIRRVFGFLLATLLAVVAFFALSSSTPLEPPEQPTNTKKAAPKTR